MTDQKWLSPTGHPIASHETDHIPDGGRMEAPIAKDVVNRVQLWIGNVNLPVVDDKKRG